MKRPKAILRQSLSLFRREASVATGPGQLGIEELTAVCSRAAEGEIDARVIGIPVGGKIAPLAHSINHLLDIFDAYVRESTASMEECSHGRFHRPIILRGMPGAFQEASRIINRAALKMRGDDEIAKLEDGRREVVDRVNASVSVACEELTVTASEILRQTTDCCELAASVVKRTEDAYGSVHQLAELAGTIGTVVKLITELAEATNMLAINASIEAAHAGDKGRGFGVVASGVKQLSRDTRDATATISTRVAAIQNGVLEVRGAIGGIAGVVDTLNKNANYITAAVTEQVTATEEISRRLAEIVAVISGKKTNFSNHGEAATGTVARATNLATGPEQKSPALAA